MASTSPYNGGLDEMNKALKRKSWNIASNWGIRNVLGDSLLLQTVEKRRRLLVRSFDKYVPGNALAVYSGQSYGNHVDFSFSRQAAYPQLPSTRFATSTRRESLYPRRLNEELGLVPTVSSVLTQRMSGMPSAFMEEELRRENSFLRQELRKQEEFGSRAVETAEQEYESNQKLNRELADNHWDVEAYRKQVNSVMSRGEQSSLAINSSVPGKLEDTTRNVSSSPILAGEESTNSAGDEDEPQWKKLYGKINDPAKVDERRARELDIQFVEASLQNLKVSSKAKSKKKPEDKTLIDAFTPISEDAELIIDQALSKSADGYEIIVQHEKSNIDLTRTRLQCLLPGLWLNDEVINVYMDLLKERELREPKRFLKCHFFNTFFYNKLYKDKRTYDYKAIRRWTTEKKLGYSLSSCDKILVPIHQDIHWCLAVINIQDKKLEYLDSLQGGDRAVLEVLGRYIVDEAKDKDGKTLDVSNWQHDYPKDIPEQKNGCDCGMFMAKYADFHSRGAPLQFTQENMNYFRKRMVWEILQLKAT